MKAEAGLDDQGRLAGLLVGAGGLYLQSYIKWFSEENQKWLEVKERRAREEDNSAGRT